MGDREQEKGYRGERRQKGQGTGVGTENRVTEGHKDAE